MGQDAGKRNRERELLRGVVRTTTSWDVGELVRLWGDVETWAPVEWRREARMVLLRTISDVLVGQSHATMEELLFGGGPSRVELMRRFYEEQG